MNTINHKYFLSKGDAFRYDGNNRFTRIENDDKLGMTEIKKGVLPMFVDFSDIQPISARQFKAIFLNAISEIAGFKIDPDWEDEEADVQQAKVIG